MSGLSKTAEALVEAVTLVTITSFLSEILEIRRPLKDIFCAGASPNDSSF
jgi:hypothetical protein